MSGAGYNGKQRTPGPLLASGAVSQAQRQERQAADTSDGNIETDAARVVDLISSLCLSLSDIIRMIVQFFF